MSDLRPKLRKAFDIAIANGNIDRVRRMLSSSPEWGQVRNDVGVPPLIRACTSQSHVGEALALELVQLLLPFCDPDARDHNGLTALMYAASRNRLDLVRSLLPKSNAQLQDEAGVNALMRAAEHQQPQCIGILLPVSDLQQRTKSGRLAWEWVLERGYWAGADALMQTEPMESVRALVQRVQAVSQANALGAPGLFGGEGLPVCRSRLEQEALNQLLWATSMPSSLATTTVGLSIRSSALEGEEGAKGSLEVPGLPINAHPASSTTSLKRKASRL